jgi:hypothetical protein
MPAGAWDFSGPEELRWALEKYSQKKNQLFGAYLIRYDPDQEEGRHFLSLEPAGEGLPSCSFEIDL